MSREITVVTPENVTITYELGGLGSRAVAYLLDSLIQLAGITVALLIFWLVSLGVGSLQPGRTPGPIMDVMLAILFVVLFVIVVGYYVYFEGLRNGQTPGKHAMGLRVVRDQGVPVDFSSATIRNLVRLFEMVLGLHLMSIISILFSSTYKRIGDFAAGTMVVKERSPSAAVPEMRASVSTGPATAEAAYVRDIDLLTSEELAAIRRFVERRWQLALPVQEDLARRIAEPVIARLGIQRPPGDFSHANFLEEVYKRCAEERGML